MKVGVIILGAILGHHYMLSAFHLNVKKPHIFILLTFLYSSILQYFICLRTEVQNSVLLNKSMNENAISI